MDHTSILLTLTFIFVVVFLISTLKKLLNTDVSKTDNKTIAPIRKNFSLCNTDGSVIKVWEGVYPLRWDKNIYMLYKEPEQDLIVKIDKGDNMLVVIEEYKNKENLNV